jgi:hypothetical protein
VDVDSGEAGVQGIVLSLKNPTGVEQRGDKLYFTCVGAWGVLTDGGIEVVDLSSNETEGALLTETALGGDAAGLAMMTESEGYVVLSDASWNNSVVKVDLLTKRVTPVFAEAGGGSIPGMGYLKGRMYVLDRGGWDTPESNVYVYDTSDHSLLAGPISTGIPPDAITFVTRAQFSTVLAGDFDGDDDVDFEDYVAFASAFGSTPGAANWDPKFDLDRDDRVDFDDFAAFARSFGQSK